MPAPTDHAAESHGFARPIVEAVVGLAISVALFRGFAVEGFMISTGSMAPALYGYHKRVDCPSCGLTFARRASPPRPAADVVGDSSNRTASLGDAGHARCPNCDRAIETAGLPRNHGDQLLVLKHAFDLFPPRRWEPAVFRNPNEPEQAYVKRVVGLPGEHIRVSGGDVFIDGEIARKSPAAVLETRISGFDTARRPEDAALRWRPAGETEVWHERPTGWRFRPTSAAAAGRLAYRHEIRGGGSSPTTVTIPEPFRVAVETVSHTVPRLAFDPGDGRLTTRGVLAETTRRALEAVSGDDAYRHAVASLATRSRLAPVDDRYGYNADANVREHAVADLMLEADVSSASTGTVALEVDDGRASYRFTADLAAGTGTLGRNGTGKTIRRGRLDVDPAPAVTLGLAVVDGRATAFVGRSPAFPPIDHEVSRNDPARGEAAVSVSAAGGTIDFVGLRLFRDVYYTDGRGRNGVETEYRLGPDEYFVLGDNSPISLDSRAWDRAAVPASLLIGKPFVVHLPSKPGRFRIGDRDFAVRLPDLERVRLIR